MYNYTYAHNIVTESLPTFFQQIDKQEWISCNYHVGICTDIFTLFGIWKSCTLSPCHNLTLLLCASHFQFPLKNVTHIPDKPVTIAKP